MPSVGFAPAIPATERPQSYALYHTATGTDAGTPAALFDSMTILTVLLTYPVIEVTSAYSTLTL